MIGLFSSKTNKALTNFNFFHFHVNGASEHEIIGLDPIRALIVPMGLGPSEHDLMGLGPIRALIVPII